MKLSERLATRPKPLPEAQQNSKNAFDNEVRSYLSQRFVDEGASNIGSSNMDSPRAGKSLMYTPPWPKGDAAGMPDRRRTVAGAESSRRTSTK